MGADAAALLAARRGGQLAAVALFSGGYERLLREPPAQAAEQLSGVGLRAFHAASDTYAPPQHSRDMFEWLCGRLGGEVGSPTTAAFDDPEPPYWDLGTWARRSISRCWSATSLAWRGRCGS
ncbi:unnamed protein product, partial [Prorocentrum cordatum]